MSYAKERQCLKSGTLLLFSGKGTFSEGIKMVTASDVSHIGVVVRLDVGGEELVCVFESTTLGNVADIDGKFKKGVQTVQLSSRLESYDGEVWARIPSRSLTEQELAGLLSFRREVNNRPYESNLLQLAKSAIDLPGWVFKHLHLNEEDLSSLFCSELVAEGLQRIGVLEDDIASNEFTPADFQSGRVVDEITIGLDYGPELKLK